MMVNKLNKRKIAIFTGNRAEYGLQYPIIKAVSEHPDLEYYLLVSGAHLQEDFGYTAHEIEQDGFKIHSEVKLTMEQDTLFATSQAIGTGILSLSQILDELRPDLFVVYADRYEGFSAVITGTQMNIPTAHIEGGDLTEGGALDDSVRHAMTKLSHLHFTTNQQASNRILAMGEEDWRVHTVGFPAIDLIQEDRYASPDEVIERLSLDLAKPVVLFTQHSVTTEFDQAVQQLEPSLEALETLAGQGVQIIVTYPNNDAGGRAIIQSLEAFDARKISGVQTHRSLGRHLYHGVLALALNPSSGVVCAGNSSSGIKETPAFGCPTVNIGSRQDGRLRADNVIDAAYDANSITEAIRRCLFDEDFRVICRDADNPYYLGGAGKRVAEVLATVKLDRDLLRKKMTLKGEVKDGWYR